MNNELLHLLQLCDPALPVGGFSHSAGLETYVQREIVKNKETAQIFLKEMLSKNIFYNDAAFVSICMLAAEKNNLEKLIETDHLANACKLPEEIRAASHKLGNRLLKIFQPICKNDWVNLYHQSVLNKQSYGHYAIAFAIIATALGISRKEALTGFFYNAAAGMVTNCVKLIPLSQQTGQELLFEVKDLISDLVSQIENMPSDYIGICSTGFDIASMEHEYLYSRLYMS